MDSLLATPVFQSYIVATLLLGGNLLLLANNTAITRTLADEVVNPEDVVLNAKAAVIYEAGNSKTERYRRAHRNALENIPLFLITGFLLTLTPVPATAAMVLFGIFVAARLSHSVCYLFGFQPFRTASFAIGALDQLALLGFLAYYVFI